MSFDETSKSFDHVALEEMSYVYQRAEFSKPIGHLESSDQKKLSKEDEFAPTPKEFFDSLCASRNTLEARSIAFDKNLPPLNGLSLSGGGIRSASFCLGVVEGLAELGVLNQFHYVSSVSGGGYTAGWLGAWSYRVPDGIAGVQRTMREAAAKSSPPQEVQHISRYVAYLAPRAGVLSADLWSLLSAYFRNLLITLGTILPAVVILAGLPMAFALLSIIAGSSQPVKASAAVLCVLAAIVVGIAMRALAEANDHADATRNARWARALAQAGPGVGGAAFAIALSAGGIVQCFNIAAVHIGPKVLWSLVVIAVVVAAGLALWQLTRSYLASRQSLLPRYRVSLRAISARWKHCVWMSVSIVLTLLALIMIEVLANWAIETFSSVDFHAILTRGGCGRKLGLPGGSSCIPTKIGFELLSSTSSWASASDPRSASWVIQRRIL